MSNPAIDQPTFKELQEAAGADFVAELVDTFLQEAPRMMSELRDALAAGDSDAYRRIAHSFKSNAGNFGALPLAEQLRAIELNGLPTDAGPLDALQTEYDRTAAALKNLANG